MTNGKGRPTGDGTAPGISKNVGNSINSPAIAVPQVLRRQAIIDSLVREAGAQLTIRSCYQECVTIEGRRFSYDIFGQLCSWTEIYVPPPGDGWKLEPGSRCTWVRTVYPFGKPAGVA